MCTYVCGTHAHEDHRLTQMKSSEVLDHPPPYRLRQALLRDIRAPALLITSQLILQHPCLLPDSETAGRPPCMSKINMTVGTHKHVLRVRHPLSHLPSPRHLIFTV